MAITETIDLLFKSCCLTGIIFWIPAASLSWIVRKKLQLKSEASGNIECSNLGMQRLNFVFLRQSISHEDPDLRVLFWLQRFCMLGFIVCMALAIMLVVFSILQAGTNCTH